MRILVAAAMFAALAGCTTGSASFQPRPISTGGGANSLKRTPCAGPCGAVKQKAGLPEFLQTMKVEA
jgi:hypothetical protein